MHRLKTSDLNRFLNLILTALGFNFVSNHYIHVTNFALSGSKRDTKLTANTCSWNVEVSALTSFQRNALRKGYYRKNCECKVCNCIVQQLARATYFNVLSY